MYFLLSSQDIDEEMVTQREKDMLEEYSSSIEQRRISRLSSSSSHTSRRNKRTRSVVESEESQVLSQSPCTEVSNQRFASAEYNWTKSWHGESSKCSKLMQYLLDSLLVIYSQPPVQARKG